MCVYPAHHPRATPAGPIHAPGDQSANPRATICGQKRPLATDYKGDGAAWWATRWGGCEWVEGGVGVSVCMYVCVWGGGGV